MADEAVKRIIIDLIPESKPFFEVMPEYDGERQTVILDPGLVQKAFWEIIFTAQDINSLNIKKIIDGLKDADMIYKLNPVTNEMEPYMKQYQLNETYKVLLRKDWGGFNDHDINGDHWNLEIQTTGGRTVYDLHVYLDENGELIPFTDDNIYIPKKSPFRTK